MPEYKVHYFDFTGRAEPIRMILSYGGIKFEDVRIGREEFLKLKPSLPYGQLPVLEIDGKMIPQSIAICRHLATITKLGGKDAVENVRIDIAVDSILDLQKKVQDFAMEKDEERKKILEQKAVNETLPLFLKVWDEKASRNEGFVAINRLTWADILFICWYEEARNMLKKDFLADYPNLQKIKRNILAVPSLQEWIRNRPQNKMMSTYDLKQDL